MKKVLMYQLVISLILLIVLVGCGKEDQPPVKTWSDDLDSVVEAYNDCPEGWEKNIIERPYLPKKMYCNRPPLPKDFGGIVLLYETNKLTNYSLLDKEYWDQPEFFPNFKSLVVPVLSKYDKKRFGVTIPEIYPAGKVYTNVSPGWEFTAQTFVRSGPLGVKYILLDAYTVFPETFFWGMNKDPKNKYYQTNVSQYFEVKIEPENILFEPSFPVWPKNWTKPLFVHVKVKENTPPGRYAIGVDFDHTKNTKLVEQMLFKYTTKYVTTLLVKPGIPWYTIYIEVV